MVVHLDRGRRYVQNRIYHVIQGPCKGLMIHFDRRRRYVKYRIYHVIYKGLTRS